MTVRMKRKGQTALEAAFVVLFIIISVSLITGFVKTYGSNIQKMAEVRAMAQGVSMELSMNGTTTHLVRVDPADSDKGAIIDAKLYVFSEDCTLAQSRFRAVIGNLIATGTSGWNCSARLFGH